MNNDELKKKIMEILHRDFIAREVTPVYVGEDEKEKIMPQKLCDVFNNLTEQALIPYFADALIEAGIGDVEENENRARAAEFAAKTVTDKAIRKYKEMKHRAEVAERALLNMCIDKENLRREWYSVNTPKGKGSYIPAAKDDSIVQYSFDVEILKAKKELEEE